MLIFTCYKYFYIELSLVHEWAHLRYGVFNEHGDPKDPDYPLFDINPVSGNVELISCSSSISGYPFDSKTKKDCKAIKSSGVFKVDPNCVLEILSDTKASIMFKPFTSKVCVQNLRKFEIKIIF